MNQLQNKYMKKGVYEGIPNEEYHSWKWAVSNSGLSDILKSPFHYFAKHLDPKRPKDKTKGGQMEGTLAHCAILEPDEFSKRYIVGPDLNRNTNKWKAFAAECEEKGIIPIKSDQYDTAMRQGDSVRKHPELKEVLTKGRSEVSAVWEDPDSGLLARCRPDWVYEPDDSGTIILDVKTFNDASPDEFSRQVSRKGYHRQDGMYREGYSLASDRLVHGFLFIAVEDSWPFAVSVNSLDDDSAEIGRIEFRHAMDLYAEAAINDMWPSFEKVSIIRLPEWKLKSL